MNKLKDVIQFRHQLHMHPELSGREVETSKRIQKFLENTHPTRIISELGENGLAAVYGSENGSPCVMVRCELDALPIQEINELEYKSKDDGISHKCGHDGHMSILAALSSELHNLTEQHGKVVLLFQPAEENGEGAQAVLKDEKFDLIIPDYIVSLHNVPGYKMHQVLCKTGSFTPAVKSIIIELAGKSSHAGEPHKGINPAMAIAEFIEELNKMNIGEGPDMAILTPIQIEMGEEAYGISAGSAVIKYTIRCWTNKKMEELGKKIISRIEHISIKHKLIHHISWTQEFASNQNHAELVEVIERSAMENSMEYKEMDVPFPWGEDFGLFTERFKGAMFGLGAGMDTPALHNPDYDFPDDLIISGKNMFKSIISNLLKRDA